MKTLNYLVLLIAMFGLALSADAQDVTDEATNQVVEVTKVNVYYFHNTRRCATCEAVEAVTKSTLKESYPEQIKSGLIAFQSINIEDDSNEALARKLNVSGQTLLIVKDGKKKDLTNDAFLYARSKPEKLTEKIKKAIGTI